MSETKKKFHLNWVDVIIIAVVIVLAASALIVRNMMTGKKTEEEYTIRFTCEAQSVVSSVIDGFTVGSDVYNTSTDKYIGKIVSVRSEPHEYMSYSSDLAKYVTGYDNGVFFDLYIEIEGEGYIDETDIHVAQETPKVGKTMYLKCNNCALGSYVIDIDTMDAPVPEDDYEGEGDVNFLFTTKTYGLRQMSLDAVKIGDRIYEGNTKSLLGVVEKIDIEPYLENQVVGDAVVIVERPDRFNLILTLRCNGYEKEDEYFIDKVTELRVGAGSGCYIASRFLETSFTFFDILEVKQWQE